MANESLGWMASIGSGREQCASIMAAKRMGWSVVALDANPRAPGLSIADHAIVVDLNDRARCGDALEEFHIRGVIPAPVGRILRTVGYINDRYGLRGLSESAAQFCADKHLFDSAVRSGGAIRPNQIASDSFDRLRMAADEVGYPCILKPSLGSGSAGIRVCWESKDLPTLPFFDPTLGEILCEEFLEGQEVGVDAVVIDGEVHTVLIRGKVLTPLPNRQEMGFNGPVNVRADEIENQLQLCASAIGLEDCLVHADVMLTEKGAVVLEMSGRPAGLLISELLVPLATGVDFLGLGIALLHSPIEAKRISKSIRASNSFAMTFLSSPPGEVISVPIGQILGEQEGVVHAEIWAKPGDLLHPIRTAEDVLARGVVIASGRTLEEATEFLNRAVDAVGKISVRGGEKLSEQ